MPCRQPLWQLCAWPCSQQLRVAGQRQHTCLGAAWTSRCCLGACRWLHLCWPRRKQRWWQRPRLVRRGGIWPLRCRKWLAGLMLLAGCRLLLGLRACCSCGNHRGGGGGCISSSTAIAALTAELFFRLRSCCWWLYTTHACRCFGLLLLRRCAHHAHMRWRRPRDAAASAPGTEPACLLLLLLLQRCSRRCCRAVQPLLGVTRFQSRQPLLPSCRIVALLAGPGHVEHKRRLGPGKLPIRQQLRRRQSRPQRQGIACEAQRALRKPQVAGATQLRQRGWVGGWVGAGVQAGLVL